MERHRRGKRKTKIRRELGAHGRGPPPRTGPRNGDAVGRKRQRSAKGSTATAAVAAAAATATGWVFGRVGVSIVRRSCSSDFVHDRVERAAGWVWIHEPVAENTRRSLKTERKRKRKTADSRQPIFRSGPCSHPNLPLSMPRYIDRSAVELLSRPLRRLLFL